MFPRATLLAFLVTSVPAVIRPITSSNELPPTDKAEDTIPNELASWPEDTENWFAVSLLYIKYKC